MNKVSTMSMALVAGIALVAGTVGAAPEVVYEPFDYEVTTGDNTQSLRNRDGGTGFGGAWTVGGNVNAVPPENGYHQVTAPGMTFGELPVAGNFAGRTLHTGNIAFANRPISAGAQSTLTASDSTIWFSMLIRPTGIADFNVSFADQEITTANSAVLAAAGNGFGLDLQGTALRAISWENATTRTSSTGSLTLSANTIYLIAGEINWAAGTTGNVLNLYNITDPTADSPGTAFATKTADFDQLGINTFGIRDRLNAAAHIDEIRFATSFEGAMGRASVPVGTVIVLK